MSLSDEIWPPAKVFPVPNEMVYDALDDAATQEHLGKRSGIFTAYIAPNDISVAGEGVQWYAFPNIDTHPKDCLGLSADSVSIGQISADVFNQNLGGTVSMVVHSEEFTGADEPEFTKLIYSDFPVYSNLIDSLNLVSNQLCANGLPLVSELYFPPAQDRDLFVSQVVGFIVCEEPVENSSPLRRLVCTV